MAFAPMPFEKANRRDRGADDLARMQGEWVRVEYNGKPEPTPIPATIAGDRIRYVTDADAWVITLDASRTPRLIDFVRVSEPKSVYRGVYRLEGDTLTYGLRRDATPERRALDFETTRPDSWVGVYRRKRP